MTWRRSPLSPALSGVTPSDVEAKTDKVIPDTAGNLAGLTVTGNLEDSTITPAIGVDQFTLTGGTGTPRTLTIDETKSLSGKADKLIAETAEKTADYTLVIGDAGKIVLMNKTGAATLTVPTNANVAFPVGTIVGVYNVSSDDVTIAGDGGVIVRNAGDLAQYGEVSLRKRATDEWVLAGAVS